MIDMVQMIYNQCPGTRINTSPILSSMFMSGQQIGRSPQQTILYRNHIKFTVIDININIFYKST
ncbi:hypothetical protein NQ317_013394 [Molorchus minor]|uniref:Uncharacterized protein n=1 Tax=Molorchus minor TaxID=1323400 RepID=A0ABQ9J7S5_9CUCU|nr:hypothetical protein NQ317_013394 [Molorchus minor]